MNANGMGGFEERGFDSVVCPKPRRLSDHTRTFRWPTNCYQTEMVDSKAGTELLDIILTKGGFGAEKHGNQVASSPPFFCGSPPSRSSNPINDGCSLLFQMSWDFLALSEYVHRVIRGED
ncbi:hypothetical protein CRYUN_Cryun13aG0063200 [Craigia yunnanensis]